MKLKVELITGPQAGALREVDGTHPFTIGTTPEAHWHLSGLAQAASVEIRRDAEGFVLDPTGAVTIEGQPVTETQVLRLGQGSQIGLGGALLRASVTQDAVAGQTGSFARPAQPTISSILSDVTPGGASAQGPLPGRGGEEWLASLTQTAPNPAPGAPLIPAFGEGETAPNALLPDDWNTPTDDQNSVFQADAPTTSVAIGSSDGQAEDHNKVDETALALLRALDLTQQDAQLSGVALAQNAGHALRMLLSTLQQMERNHQIFCRELDVQGGSDELPLHAATLLADRDGLAIGALQGRVQELVESQSALFDGVLEGLREARETLDPVAIQTYSSTTTGLAGRLSPTAQAWREFETRWGTDDTGPLAARTIANKIAVRGKHAFRGVPADENR